ncbi:unnamed protein product [Camellia sinensis]
MVIFFCPDLGGFVACSVSGQCFVQLVVLFDRGEDHLISFRRRCCCVEVDVGFITIVCGYFWFCLSRLCEKGHGFTHGLKFGGKCRASTLVVQVISGLSPVFVLLLEFIH